MAKEKLTKKIIEQAVELKSSGLNDCDIAAALQVHPGTLSRWINRPESNLDLPLEAVFTRMYEASCINPFEEMPDRVTKLQYRLDLSDVSYLDEIETVESLIIEDIG